MRDVISGCTCFGALLLRFDKKTVLPVYVLRTHFYVYRYAYVYFARLVVNLQHSIGCLVVFSWYDVITCEK